MLANAPIKGGLQALVPQQKAVVRPQAHHRRVVSTQAQRRVCVCVEACAHPRQQGVHKCLFLQDGVGVCMQAISFPRPRLQSATLPPPPLPTRTQDGVGMGLMGHLAAATVAATSLTAVVPSAWTADSPAQQVWEYVPCPFLISFRAVWSDWTVLC